MWFLENGTRFTTKDNEKSVLKKCRTWKFFLCRLKTCLEHVHPVLLSVPSLCLVSIKCPSFVYCIVSLQRKGKFSAIYADIWIPCLKVWIIQTEPSAFWPLAGSLARGWGPHLSNSRIPSIWLFDLAFTGQYFLFLLICLLSC